MRIAARFAQSLALVTVASAAILILGAAPAAALTATDIPMWYDVSQDTTPANTKLNTDITPELQNEQGLAVDPTNPDNLVANWRDFRLGYRQVGQAYTHDGGNTWTETGLMTAHTPYDRDSDPIMAVTAEGKFYSCILSFDPFAPPNALVVAISQDSGVTWGNTEVAVEASGGDFEDKQWITVDHSGGPTHGNVYVPWARFYGSGGVDIFCVAGSEPIPAIPFIFFNPEVLVSDVSSVQWPVPAVGPDGKVIVAWFSYANKAIMCDESTNGGASFGVDRIIEETTSFPVNLNGGIFTFPFPALMADNTGGPGHGSYYLAFGDETENGDWDIHFRRSLDGGATWTPKIRINDDPVGNGADQFHPWLAVNPDGVLTVVFFDRRRDPANYLFELWVTHSFDGGLTWTPNQRISEVQSSPGDALYARATGEPFYEPYDHTSPLEKFTNRAGLIGEYTGLVSTRLRANTVFTDTRNGNQDTYAAQIPLRLFPPLVTGPDDGLLTKIPTHTHEWTNWSDYDSALVYTLEHSTEPGFTSNNTRVTGITAQAHPLTLPDGFYYWHVRATDHFGDSSKWSETRTLWIDATAPDAPTYILPAMGDSITDTTPTFQWSAATTGKTPSPVTYLLEIDDDPLFGSPIVYPGLMTDFFILPPPEALAAGQQWHWRVEATDAAGNASGHSTPDGTFYIKLPYILGDFNGDLVIDVLDVVANIDYVFRSGTAPVPEERVDTTCEGVVDVLDVIEMIDHVFRSAPAPECP